MQHKAHMYIFKKNKIIIIKKKISSTYMYIKVGIVPCRAAVGRAWPGRAQCRAGPCRPTEMAGRAVPCLSSRHPSPRHGPPCRSCRAGPTTKKKLNLIII